MANSGEITNNKGRLVDRSPGIDPDVEKPGTTRRKVNKGRVLAALAIPAAVAGLVAGKDDAGKWLRSLENPDRRAERIEIKKTNQSGYETPSADEAHRIITIGKTYVDREGNEHHIATLKGAANYVHAMNPDISIPEALDYFYATNYKRQKELGVPENTMTESSLSRVHLSDQLIAPVIFGAGELVEPDQSNSANK